MDPNQKNKNFFSTVISRDMASSHQNINGYNDCSSEIPLFTDGSWSFSPAVKGKQIFLFFLLLFGFFAHQAEGSCYSRLLYGDQSCIRSQEGKVKCWGFNDYGQLGYGDNLDRGDEGGEMSNNLPYIELASEGNETVIIFAAGDEHHCVLLSTLKVKCWGNNPVGNLGQGNNEDLGDEIGEMGNNLSYVNLGTDQGSEVTILKLYAAFGHNGIVTDLGKIKTWGGGSGGRLGYGSTTSKGDGANEMGNYLPFVNVGTGLTVQMLALSHYVTLSFFHDGSVKAWGWNLNGQLGQGHTTDLGNGPNELGDYLPPISLPTGITVDKVVSGNWQLGVISSIGELYLWGRNLNGQLGIGSVDSIGDSPNEMSDYLKSVNLGTGYSAVDMQGGYEFSCALLNTFDMKCWGDNDEGQLGYGDVVLRGDSPNMMGDYLPLINLGSGITVSSIHVGEDHVCAILNGGSFKCWGRNFYGQLGKGNTLFLGDGPFEMGNYLLTVNVGPGVEVEACEDYAPTISPSYAPTTPSPSFQPTFEPTEHPTITYSPSQFEIGCRSQMTSYNRDCLLTIPSKGVKCFGDNQMGSLGYGDFVNRGDDANEMGNYLDFIDLNGTQVISVHTGYSHTCVRLINFDIKCWGTNFDALLGLGDNEKRGDEPFEMGENLSVVNMGSMFVVDMYAGYDHSIVLGDDGQIKSWGNGLSGQTGYGGSSDRGDNANEMGDYLPYNNLGTGRYVIDFYGIQAASCALLDNYGVKCWGSGTSGKLGSGSSSSIGDDPSEMGDYLPFVKLPPGVIVSRLRTGRMHSGIIDTTGELWMWGRNSNGQLGLGHNQAIGDGPNEMGNNMSSTYLGAGRTVVDFSGGSAHTCTILDNFGLKCWGDCGAGQVF